MNPGFRRRLSGPAPLIGTIVTLDSPAAAERLALAGFDWLFIDGEHAPLGPAGIQALLQAIGGRCPAVVRVPVIDETWIKKALDAGADGVIVPQVRGPEDARKVVSWSRYPPQGERGVGVARAQGYGASFDAYLGRANDDLAVILQIEHPDAVSRVAEIAAVDGVDALFVGPYDLSTSMGTPGQVGAAPVVEAIGNVARACREAGIAPGIFGMTADDLRPWLERGFTLVAVGIDVVWLGRAAEAALESLRN
ncbi:MAG: aldolase/citrate lyase family protein [Gammaproteobacteria bacterium]|nr:aldolase/citrate lyase family protein [Gammaproteobacteria bacterium]